MLFNTFAFVFGFLPIALLSYWSLRSTVGIRASNLALLACSLAFYAYGESRHLYLILLSIGFNHLVGIRISRSKDPSGWLLALGVGGDLLALGYFKYAAFLHDNLRLLGVSVPLPAPVELPVGISFFTFTQIAYLVDCYRRKASDYDLGNYGLFVTFFPHLVAGPILHHSEMMPQFARHTRVSIGSHLNAGLAMFAIGLFKKTVIADSIAVTATELFADAARGHDLTLLPAWIGALAYTAQIYFDFSGYSDMAVGLARMFGIDLPINFNSPYKAVSIADFWRRWHITLSRFLRDYLYIPLGGNRHGRLRQYLNLFITMVLGGFWHGASWNFVLWGALHGTYLAIERWVMELRGQPDVASSRVSLVGRALTFVLVVFAWVPFRAPDFAATWHLWKGMIGLNGFELPLAWPLMPAIAHALGLPTGNIDIHPVVIMSILGALVVAMVFPNSQQIMARFTVGLDSPGYAAVPGSPSRWAARQSLPWAILLGLVMGIAVVFIGGYSEFIYFQF